MPIEDFLDEFEADWRLLGRSTKTARAYRRLVADLVFYAQIAPNLGTVKAWLTTAPSKETATYRGRALRAFGKWAEVNEVDGWTWWRQVPLANVAPTPQPTVTEREVEELLRRLTEPQDRLLIELLWSTGLRVPELSRSKWDDANLNEGYVVVRQSKTGKPRLAPLSGRVCRMTRRTQKDADSLLGLSSQAIQRRLNRLNAPTAHSFRRGWAVQALRNGESQTSVQAATSWRSGAMVKRYAAQASSGLAISEFSRVELYR